MKNDLAAKLLGKVMEWSPEELAARGQDLQVLARLKYDEYEGYRPGEKFIENLARWLWQFETKADREQALKFVLQRLVFVSRAELEHIIELVYPDFVRPLVRERVAEELGLRPHQLTEITSSSEFRRYQRQLIVLGLADGARIDRLRRASPELSHEQFSVVFELSKRVIEGMQAKLAAAMRTLGLDGPARFRHVLLIDDFYGSGYTLIREEGDDWGGKVIKAKDSMQSMRDAGALADDAEVTILVYVASETALDYLRSKLAEAGLNWDVQVVQTIPNSSRVVENDIRDLCSRYYDDILTDDHKGSAVFGFRDGALPLVLSHNTPNNSIALLWGETVGEAGSENRRALFPRYERHHEERP